MMNNAERAGDPAENNTEKNSLEDMPSFEEHMDQMKSSKQESSESSLSETEQQNDPNRQLVSAGDHSAIYNIIEPDGGSHVLVESEYFEMAMGFTSSHEELKKDFELRYAMDSFSMSLALIDATKGRNFEKGGEKSRSSLLEDYSILRSRLDNPDTTSEEKQLITDYFDLMKGNALDFIESHYDPEEEKEKAEQREKFNSLLDNTREKLKSAKMIFSEDSAAFDRALSQIDELVESHSLDIDSLRSKLTRLIGVTEELTTAIDHFSDNNMEYENTLIRGKDYMDEGDYRSSRNQVFDNDDEITNAHRKLSDVDDHIAKIKRYMSKVEDTLYKLKRL